jgi:hypothetical protein
MNLYAIKIPTIVENNDVCALEQLDALVTAKEQGRFIRCEFLEVD